MGFAGLGDRPVWGMYTFVGNLKEALCGSAPLWLWWFRATEVVSSPGSTQRGRPWRLGTETTTEVRIVEVNFGDEC